MADYPKGSRKLDCALTDMRAHLDWLADHRRSPTDPVGREVDLAREVGVRETMDTLVRYGAKMIEVDRG